MSNRRISITVSLPEELVAKIDEERKGQIRSRSNMLEKRLMEIYGMVDDPLDARAQVGGQHADKE